jgi:hypothetical protein
MKRYLNLKTNYGIETVDQLDSKDFNSLKEFKAELKRLLNEYHISGMQVYLSQRKAK